MADKQTGGLSLRIGLTLSQLQSDFLAAEQTVKQGIAALNRQQNIVRLRMEADTAGLDAVTDKAKILEIQERSLTQILDMQRDKLRLASAAYQDVAKSKGENSTVAKQLEASVERERLAVARLEAQLKSLSAQKITFDAAKLQDSVSKLNAKIQNVRIKAEIDTSKLKSAGEVFDAQKVHVAALTRELELQRQKLAQLQAQMYKSAQQNGVNSTPTLNFKSNVLRQIQEINQLQAKLREVQNTNINVQVRADSLRRVEAEITEKISLLNSKLEHIRVKTDIDVSKLGSAASEFDKARAHVQGLNRELDLQNQKLAQMRQALGASVSANGLNNVKTINLQTEIQKQIQAIDQLKAKINELNKIQPPKTNNLLSGYLNTKSDITGKLNSITSAFANLKGATSSADSAVTSVLTVIGEIPHPVGRAVAALAGLPLIFKGIENSIIEMTRAAAVSGDAVYVMSRGMQMSIKDAGKFSTNAKVAGTDVNSLRIAVQNVQRQIVKGGDDSRGAEWLKRYGESAYDASGNIKNLNDMTVSLSRALHKAQAEGKGSEFVFNTFRNISPDDITAIEDWIAVNEQASKIVKNGLANPALAHEVKGNLNALAVQEGQLKASFESALLPVANEIIPRITDRLGRMTQVIADNKEMIRAFGRAAVDAFLKVEEAAETVGKAFLSVGKAYYDWQKNPLQDAIIEKYKNNADIKSVDDLIKAEQPKAYDVIKANPFLYQQVRSIYEPMFRALDDVQKEIKRKNEELAKQLEKPLTSVADISSAAADRLKVEQNPELLKQAESVKKILQEASDIQYKLNHSDFENKKLDLLQWRQDMLNQVEMTEEKRLAIEKLYAAKLDQLHKEQAEKTQEHYRNAADIEYNLTHTAFEKQLRDIELWKEAQREKASTAEEVQGIIAESAAKEAEAFEAAMDRIRGKLQSLDDKIFAQEHSQYENDLRRLEQERLKYYEDFQNEGILNANNQAKIERWYQNELAKLNKRAKDGGDYTKLPEGAMQRGGNGIMVIGADQIIDDGRLNQSIGLIADVSREHAQLSAALDEETRKRIAAIESTKQLTDAQNHLVQQTSGFQTIEGDKVVNQPTQPTTTVEQPLNELTTSAQNAAVAQTSLAESAKALPPEYFQNLADGTKAVSEMQLRLTDSTMHLIDAQGKLAAALENFSPTRETSSQPTDGFMKLSAVNTRDISDIPPQQPVTTHNDTGFKPGFDMNIFSGIAQTGLATIALFSRLGALAPHPAAKAAAIILGGAAGAAAGKGVGDATYGEHLNALPTDIDLSAIVTPLGKIDTNVQSILQAIQPQEQSSEADRFQEYFGALPNIESYVQDILLEMQTQAEGESPDYLTPLSNISDNVQSILQQMQDTQANENDRLQEYLGALPNIEASVQDILLELQARGEVPDSAEPTTQTPAQTAIDYTTLISGIDGKLQSVLDVMPRQETISFETVVTPLNNIAGLVGNILTALENRQPPQITVAPNNNIDIGGAYVFDNALKSELVNDITTRIVEEITKTVQQATSRTSYGYGA